MRSAVASSLPGGLPRGVFYFDGTIPTTESHGAFPAFAGSTCPTSVHEAAPTADSSPRDAKDLFGSQGAPQGKRHKGAAGSTNVSYHRSVGWSCYDSEFGVTRRKFLGLDAVDKARGGVGDDHAEAPVDFLLQRIEQETHHGPARQYLQRLYAYMKNGVLDLTVKQRSADGFIDNDSPLAHSSMQVMVPDLSLIHISEPTRPY